MLNCVTYLGFGPQLASGFAWYLRSLFFLDRGFASGFSLNDTWMAGSLLRMAAPGEFSFLRFTGWSFSQHLMTSHTTNSRKNSVLHMTWHHDIMTSHTTNSRKNSVLHMSLYYRIVNFLSIGFGLKTNNKDHASELLVSGSDPPAATLCQNKKLRYCIL